MGKKRKNVQRDQQRLQTFLQTKCIICYTPEPIPSRRLPCCKIFLHESCLLKCFQHASLIGEGLYIGGRARAGAVPYKNDKKYNN